MDLPVFKYHPDPIETGCVIESDNECVVCKKERGFIYIGPVFSEEEYEDCICPWCIADGTAAAMLEATFVDDAGVGAVGECEVSDDVIQEVTCRTPSFIGWQQEQWWTHCEDAGQFIGRAGKAELQALGPAAVEAIKKAAEDTNLDGDELIESLQKDGSSTAYMFRCLHCDAIGGYWDCD